MGNCFHTFGRKHRQELLSTKVPARKSGSFSTPEVRELGCGTYKKFISAQNVPMLKITSATPISQLSAEQKEYVDSINVIKGDYCPVLSMNAAEYIIGHFEKVSKTSDCFTVFGQRPLTYGELLRHIAMQTTFLKQLDLGTDCTCLILCSHSRLLPAILLTNLRMEHRLVLLNPKTIDFIFEDDFISLNPTVIFCTSDWSVTAVKLRHRFSSIQHLILIDTEEPPSAEFHTLKQKIGAENNTLTRQCSLKLLSPVPPQPDTFWQEKVSVIVFTIGRQGPPKMVQLTHQNLVANVAQMRHVNKIRAIDNVMGLIPLHHVFGLVLQMFGTFCAGASLCVLQKMGPTTLLEALYQQKTTVCFAVPPVVVFLAKTSKLDEFDLSNLQHMFNVAAPCCIKTVAKLMDRFPRLTFYQGYGMCETTSLTHLTTGVSRAIAHSGTVLPNLEYKIASLETGLALGSLSKGEICIRGNQIAQQSVSTCPESHTYLDQNGWLYTGDLGYFDEEKNLYITGINDRKASSILDNLNTSPPHSRVGSIRNLGMTPLVIKHSTGKDESTPVVRKEKLKKSLLVKQRSNASEGSDSVFMD